MKNKLIRALNIFKDSILYGFNRLIKKNIDFNYLLNNNKKNCAVLCCGGSLENFIFSKIHFDVIILINVKPGIKKYPEIINKIGSTPVIIVSNIGENILNYKLRRDLNIQAVFSRISVPTEKEFKKIRVRRRLEAYGLKVNSFHGYVDSNILDNETVNTGLAGVYFASLNYENIFIFGLDFYSTGYLTGGQIDFNHLEKKKGFNQETFGKFLSKNFINICLKFPRNSYFLHTYYKDFDNPLPFNLSIEGKTCNKL
jgi:hypothetical protein